MKWTSHKLLTGAIIFFITGNPLDAIATAVGSVIPDAIEGFPSDFNYNSWRRKHRQSSHWVVPYLTIFFIFHSYSLLHPLSISFDNLGPMASGSLIASLPVFTWFIAMLSLGACFHILEDGLCGTVPGFFFKKRIGITLFRVGSWREYVYVWSFSMSLLLCSFNLKDYV